MKLHEYQSKRIFSEYGVPIPRGDVAASPAEAREIAKQIGGPVVIKSQSLEWPRNAARSGKSRWSQAS